MIQKMRQRQEELDEKLKNQIATISQISGDFDGRLNQKVANFNHALKTFKTSVTERLEAKEGNYTDIINKVTIQS